MIKFLYVILLVWSYLACSTYSMVFIKLISYKDVNKWCRKDKTSKKQQKPNVESEYFIHSDSHYELKTNRLLSDLSVTFP